MAYFYSIRISKQKSVGFFCNAFYACSLGGLTSTNFAKVIIPIIYTGGNWKKILVTVSVLSLFMLIAYSRADFLYLDEALNRYEIYNNVEKGGGYIDKVLSLFFGNPILFSEIHWSPNVEGKSPLLGMIDIGYYNSAWQYTFILTILSLVVFSIWKGYREKLVQVLILLLASDIFLHVVLKFGIAEAFIYGGHWIYIIPLLIGWVYHFVSVSKHKYFNFLLTLLTLVLIVNNLMQMTNFARIALEQYRITLF